MTEFDELEQAKVAEIIRNLTTVAAKTVHVIDMTINDGGPMDEAKVERIINLAHMAGFASGAKAMFQEILDDPNHQATEKEALLLQGLCEIDFSSLPAETLVNFGG